MQGIAKILGEVREFKNNKMLYYGGLICLRFFKGRSFIASSKSEINS